MGEQTELIRGDRDGPYLEYVVIHTEKRFNPDFDRQAVCECGHIYDRHFDGYEDNAPVGCKYCPCYLWTEPERTELVAIWKPEGEGGWMGFLIDHDSLGEVIKAELEGWDNDNLEGEIGTIRIVRKPEGWAAALPEHEGW